MHSLSRRFSAATLFLVLCLQLGISKAQDSTSIRKPLKFYLDVPKSAMSGEEITVKLGLETEYRECLVVKAYLVSPTPMEGNFSFNQTRCLCNDYRVTFYWDFPVHETVNFAIVVEITKDKNICPNDVAVVPINGDRYHTFRTVSVI
ncbi:prolactin-inducible protein homolog [Peromyscus maniculatus bairdii]|uniref:Prolactin-inducible protein homolog n=1 Tax=Peromyscus maniculatus bairdii TaxID=230844 RepID=A0A6I9ME09_PERMB|nr:prolactin-inducible protein homolog [Peromyscus maniculatus bairdii]